MAMNLLHIWSLKIEEKNNSNGYVQEGLTKTQCLNLQYKCKNINC